MPDVYSRPDVLSSNAPKLEKPSEVYSRTGQIAAFISEIRLSLVMVLRIPEEKRLANVDVSSVPLIRELDAIVESLRELRDDIEL